VENGFVGDLKAWFQCGHIESRNKNNAKTNVCRKYTTHSDEKKLNDITFKKARRNTYK
jgi:hypothetical protein